MTDRTPSPVSPAYRGVVLAMLLLVYTFNFLDRQILGILAGPIKAELGLSDGQLGALGGIAFALLYSTLAIPLALLADRTSRTWVITVSLAVWSGFTALCGMAGSFWQMFAFRVGVGVGEAGGVAPSYAVISDYFPANQRARALSIYSLGIPLGSAGGVLLGGYIAQAVEWRTAFIAVGLAGLLIAPLFRLVVREPARPLLASDAVPVSAVFGILAAKRGFWFLALGAACSSMCGYGVAFWLPSLLMRSFGLDLMGAGQFLGALLLIGGVAGVLLGGWLGDAMGGRDKAYYAWVPAISYVVGMPLFVVGVLSDSVNFAFALFLIPQALVYVWLGPVLTAVQHLVPAHMRASAAASFLLINNLVGLGLGSWSVGALSDALTPTYGVEALRYAIVAALGFYLLAGLFMALAGRALRQDWVSA
ncbi:Major facilitator family transporter [Sphingobium indicum BiD32]|uniref:Major facilitator family transporter n=1 Tax=Sphingobium indicum BiD32 TaxID=1301087 RepID=N1MH09_9SPHN|nr:MFS transporter [Sphingobium indicum]CCW16520.1 Major facilitator family transporter [Sphingobium indicum BiD32]